MSKYKNVSPQTTIKNIFSILKRLNINVKITCMKPNDNVFSCVVTGYYNKRKIGSSNGKGATKEYSLASGLSEFMERLSNDIVNKSTFLYNDLELIKESKKKFGFCIHKDEKLISLKEYSESDIFKDLFSLYKGLVFLPFFDFNKMRIDSTKKISAIPYKNILTNKIEFVPYHAYGYSFIAGSNGLSSGNTFNEAAIQGICELFERYTTKLAMCFKQKNILDINIDICNNYPNIKEIISFLNKNNFEVKLKDFSLGKNFPVVCLVLIDKETKKYFCNVGSAPVFHIALERCFTEIFQNQTLDLLKERMHSNSYNFRVSNAEIYDNYDMFFRNGSGEFPEYIIKETFKESDLSAFIIDNNEDKTIAELYEHVLEILKKNKINCYYHDSSYYGYNAYSILFSNVNSSVEFLDENVIKSFLEIELHQYGIKTFRELLYFKNYDVDVLYKCLLYFEEHRFTHIILWELYIKEYTEYFEQNDKNYFNYLLYFIAFIKNDYERCKTYFPVEQSTHLDVQLFFDISQFIICKKVQNLSDKKILTDCKKEFLNKNNNITNKDLINFVYNPCELNIKLLNLDYYFTDSSKEYKEFILNLKEIEQEISNER